MHISSTYSKNFQVWTPISVKPIFSGSHEPYFILGYDIH
jgi:hypothetical protein